MELSNKKRYLLTVAYVAANDILAFLLLTAFGFLMAEGLIPGFVSIHFPPSYLGIALLILFIIIQMLGHYLEIAYHTTKRRHAILFPVLFIFTFLLTANSMLKYPLWKNMLITLCILSTSYIIFTLFAFPSKEKN
jgi:hypothetical protein